MSESEGDLRDFAPRNAREVYVFGEPEPYFFPQPGDAPHLGPWPETPEARRARQEREAQEEVEAMLNPWGDA